MLLPGENYSEQLMFTLESYRENWVEGRTATLLGVAIASLGDAAQLNKADKAQVDAIKSNLPTGLDVDFIIDAVDVGRKAFRFSKVAAPLILADGPLPFGDVIFAVALGLDLGIAAYNLVTDDE